MTKNQKRSPRPLRNREDRAEPTFAYIGPVHTRVDQALADNRRAEQQVVGMARAIFVVDLLLLLVGYWQQNAYLEYSSGLLSGLLYLPIQEIRKLRRDNLVLQVFPILIAGLSLRAAERETQKLLAYLRGERPTKMRKSGAMQHPKGARRHQKRRDSGGGE